MITRVSTLVALFGLVILAVGISQDQSIFLAIGIGMMIIGVIGFAIGINRRQQTGNRILYMFLIGIIAVAIVFGFLNGI